MLNPGTKLGPYEIVAPLGAGGMGEVYRARDTRLDRNVAIKVLPAQVTYDAERRERFEREAKAISALNHPHICTLHDIGREGDTDFLVMELVEGQTLAARLEKGPLPSDQVLRLGLEISDALDKAHRLGIIHRDLKPGNIMLTPRNGAKLLDFGLAKPVVTPNSAATAMLTASKPLTKEGTIVGTFQYMAPEQLEGTEADARSDFFAFGAVLYEAATGKKAFEGKTTASVIAAVLASEPAPMSSLQPLTPPAFERVVNTCLAKDPDERFQSAHDLNLQLRWIADAGTQAGVPAPVASHRKNRERTAWVIAAVLGLTTITAIIVAMVRAPKPVQPAASVRLNAELGTDATLSDTTYGASAILSLDGTRLAFVAVGADKTRRLYVRSLDQMQATVLPGTEGARDPFFSPDSQWIAFFAQSKLKKISVQGGPVVTLCDALDDRGGSWGDDGSIVFAAGGLEGLSKVSSAGGKPEPLTSLNQQTGELTHRWPQVLPGSKDVIFTASTSIVQFDDADIAVYSTFSGKPKTVLHGGSYARYLPSGHLVYLRDGTLFAVPFDIKRLDVTGQPAPVVEGVASNPDNGGAQFSFSDSGTLLYVAGSAINADVSTYWMDAAGKFTPLRETPGNYNNLAISPDGKRLAMDITNGNRIDIWVYEWERDTLTRLTFAGDSNIRPIWTPDGQRIVYGSAEKGAMANLWWIRADGGGDAQRLTEGKERQVPGSWSPDGKVFALFQNNPGTSWDIMTMPVEGSEKTGWKPGQPKPFVNTSATEVYPAFSPDGRWIAYYSNESGPGEIYVRPFPGPGGKWQVSTGGGVMPEWSRNGKELFYRTNDSKIMVVSYTSSGDSFHADKPRLWSPSQFTDRSVMKNFSLHPDGKRFAVLKAGKGDTTPPPINKASFIFNFFDELRRKVPAGK
ncbi:MAG TPA: protein kinase [Terriglobia bacterium]|nr:protein kinase [Terriglobia bacterium]